MIMPPENARKRAPVAFDPDEHEAALRQERAAAFVAAKVRGVDVGRWRWMPLVLPRVPDRPDPLDDLAILLDAAALRLSKGRGAIDLALGEAIDGMLPHGGLDMLGWSRQVDFAREGLGLPARTMYEFVELARAVRDLPKLRLAVCRGNVSGKKARVIAPAIRSDPEREAFLTRVAETRTLPEIEQILRELGEPDLGDAAPKDAFVVRTKRLRMSKEMQAALDHAIELAREVLGPGRPSWVYEEAIAMEFLAAHPDLVPEPRDPPPPRRRRLSVPPSDADRERLLAEWSHRDTHEIEEALEFLLSRETDLTTGRPLQSESPEALLAWIRRLLDFRKRWDEPFGRILETISTLQLHSYFGHSSFSTYAEERLGISERGARDRVWLERKMVELPALREALLSGRLTYSKALLVAKDATPGNVRRRIVRAANTSWQQTRREADEREARQNLAAGIRRLWGPEAAMETIDSAIGVAIALIRQEGGGKLTEGEAEAMIAGHFAQEWADPVRRARAGPLRRKVLARTKGMCSSPGCGNPADHLHHVVYRSRGGPDEEWNLAPMCWQCHRRIHANRMKVWGRAGERLNWRIWRGGRRYEHWETTGNDNVRFLGEVELFEDAEAA